MDATTDRQVLELAGRDFRGLGGVERAAWDELGLRETAFWLRVNAIVSAPSPEVALEFGPLINRLARLRASRQRQRTARRAS